MLFRSGTADVVMDYSVSLHIDRRLAADDIAGSRAHVRGLGRGGLLTGEEVATLLGALDTVEGELAEGRFTFAPGDEDIHTAVERRVTELAGDVGAKLHTGRSRNDQVATDLRLWTARQLKLRQAEVKAVITALVDLAEREKVTPFPGYTHLQHAQPILFAHWCLAYVEMLRRDAERLARDRAEHEQRHESQRERREGPEHGRDVVPQLARERALDDRAKHERQVRGMKSFGSCAIGNWMNGTRCTEPSTKRSST